nr:hypothetical protein [Tanacetum cinerariifolium]
VEDLRPRGDGDDHRRDPEERVHARARAHGEEVVQPDEVGEDADHQQRVDHRRIAEEPLAGESGDDFREHAERRQDQDRPDVIVDTHIGRVIEPREGGHRQPAGARELADEQARHHQHRAGDRHPEAEVVEEREGDVACADLQRHHEVHQAGDQRHRHEEDHDHAMGGEHLVIVMRGQEALVVTE